MYKTCLTIFLQMLLLSKIDGFGKRRNRKAKSHEADTCVCSPEPQDESYGDPYCNCELAGFGIVQKIPYLPIMGCGAPVEVQFSSACVRCGLCLAIAEQINRTLLGYHDTMASGCWLNEAEVESLLESVCNEAFRHYSLREINGRRYICDPIPGSELVTSTADGLWEKNLREKCNVYLAEIGAANLYKHWQKWAEWDAQLPDLATLLCRSTHGLLRDCKHLPNSLSRLEPKAASFFSKTRFMVEFKCQ